MGRLQGLPVNTADRRYRLGFRASSRRSRITASQVRSGTSRKARNRRGSALSEFGPALFFIFIFAIFPVIDMIAIGINYCSCVGLNDLQLREAAKLPLTQSKSSSGPVKSVIPQKWKATVLGGFSGTRELPETDVSFKMTSTAVFVNVTTTCTIYPLLQIPFFPGVPGIGAPFVCKISSSRVLENPAYLTY